APLGSDIITSNPRIKEFSSPFSGETYAAVKEAKADVAIIHAHFSDQYGNIGLDRKRLMENEVDALIAKSSKKVIVSVEQIVSDEYIINNADLTFIPGIFVDAVVDTPYGAHPNAC